MSNQGHCTRPKTGAWRPRSAAGRGQFSTRTCPGDGTACNTGTVSASASGGGAASAPKKQREQLALRGDFQLGIDPFAVNLDRFRAVAQQPRHAFGRMPLQHQADDLGLAHAQLAALKPLERQRHTGIGGIGIRGRMRPMFGAERGNHRQQRGKRRCCRGRVAPAFPALSQGYDDAGPLPRIDKNRDLVAQANVGIKHLVIFRGAKVIGRAVVKADDRSADVGFEQSVKWIGQTGIAQVGADGAPGKADRKGPEINPRTRRQAGGKTGPGSIPVDVHGKPDATEVADRI